jgi:two-component system, chemotaxis family, CheB/CheR fusion protein
MGASAGGLEALQKFFTHMPPDSGMAFVVVQHLDPRHTTMMPELLGKTTLMRVQQVKDETPVEPNNVYVIPPNASLTIEGGVMHVMSPPESKSLRMGIDHLFHSLAEDQGDRAVCILMSGSGTDGTLGLRSVKEHGGMAMAQSPESAKHDSILRSAIGTGMVDHVLTPEEMPARLVEYAGYLRELHEKHSRDALLEEAGDQLTRICTLLRRKTGHDFSRYKTTTLVRRIQRRIQVHQIVSVSAYVDRLRQDPKEAEQLFRDLLIGVTHFFRDPSAFAVLEREVIPRLFDHAGPDGSIRIWTPGCATGEEAYSVAILVREEMLRRDVRPRVQIFGGDIDDEALEFARQARYPEGIAEHVVPERLERFFVKQEHSYQVAKEVREMCIFSTHNLIRDPPFSRMDLIVCRNLLIYLESDLQRHVTNVFHYALRTGGYLFLGPSESVVGPGGLFHTVDKKHRVFTRAETISVPPITLPLPERTAGQAPSRPLGTRVGPPEQRATVSALERVLLDHYAPAWVIVNAQGESVYFSPRTGRFLEPAVGAPSVDIVGMARKGLRLDLRTAIHKAVKTGTTAIHERVTVEVNGDVQQINLVVRPLAELGHDPGLYLVVFQEIGLPRSREEAQKEGSFPDQGDRVEMQQLESELRTTKEHLQASIEEVETSNEELKWSNEELLSTNEELQSANEELHTSQEEMQSVNEELETINAELSKKVDELDAANSDLQNLFQSTQIPTLFLDSALRIKRFTEAATSVFRLIEADVGRPITDIAPRFEGDLVSDFKEVLRTLSTKERQVTLADGSATYLMRVLPYRRPGNVVDGLVLTFLDVTELNRALQQQGRLAAIVESSQDAIVGRSFEGTILTWNAAAEKMFGFAADEALGRPVSIIVPPEAQEQMNDVHERLKRGVGLAPFEGVRLTRDGRRLSVSIAVSPLKDLSGRLIGASTIFRDISELKRVQEALRQEVHEKDQFLALLSHELRNPLAPLRTSLEILRSGTAAAADREKSLLVMDRQLSQLASLVDQLMDAARISSGKILLDREDVDVVELVRAVVEDHGSLLERAGLEVESSFHPKPLVVSADRLRLSQAVGNLLANAAKFTDRGGTVSVSVRDDDGQALVTVADTGIGIEPGMEERIFRPFAQAESSMGRARGGLGLGLALVRALVESHGGTVEARSAGPGRGTAFSVRLPVLAGTRDRSAAAIHDEGALRKEKSKAKRVLVVEDNVDASESLRRLLMLWGHEVEAAADGPTAVERARGFQPEVVLCDLELPGMDGYAVAKAIRAETGLPSPFLIALTGFGQADDRERSLAAGFDRHLVKPADPDQLQKLLDGPAASRRN